MLLYLLRRAVAMVLTLWVIATLTFVMMKAVPGGPFDREKKLPEAVLQNLRARYHEDWPLWRQYADYMWRLARWDLGPSFRYEAQTVNQIIARGFPVSAQLGGLVILVSLVAGVGLGVAAALRQHGWQDGLAMLVATLGSSVPSFILATLLIYVFALKLHWLPAGLWGTPARAILPTLALAALPTAVIARLVRSTMIEVLSQEYIKAARAKGMPGRVVVWRHALKNAILPVLTYLGPLTASVLTGSFVVENIFAIPGMGRLFVTSIGNRDYTVIMGTTMFYSVLLVAANFAVDLLYAVVDPRIKVAGGGEGP